MKFRRHLKDFTVKEMRLAAHLLEMAADEFANHGCNDFELLDLTHDEQIDLDKQFHDWNGDPEEHDPENLAIGYDWALMSFFAAKLKSTANDADLALQINQ